MYGGAITANTVTPSVNMKSRIINGAMVIDQRNAGASVTNSAATAVYTLDRYQIYGTSASKFTCQQNAASVTPPVGFSNYMGFTSLSANSPAATDEYIFNQRIEGFNSADLGWGTANAKTITISAWVYSSLTGTFSGALANSANNRFYPFSYSISTANTWTNISVTIAGDTSGTWVGATNGTGINVKFNLGTGSTYLGTAGAWTASFANGVTGSVNVLGTNGATFYITGVQLEVGSIATSFDYRSIETELALCYRYYQLFSRYEECLIGSCGTTTTANAPVIFNQPMRASPTVTLAPAGQTAGQIAFLTGGSYPSTIGTHSALSITSYGFRLSATGYVAGSWATGISTNLYAASNPTTVYTASAEL
jgi:hypothetical protein